MALFTTTEESLLPYRSKWHTLVNIQMVIFFASMSFGLTESIGDHVQMGRDLAFILGVRQCYWVLIFNKYCLYLQAFFIIFKTYYFCWYGDELDQVISDLDALHPWAQKGPNPVEYQTGKRWYFVMAFFLATSWSFFLCIFLLLLITSPMWVHQQNLPFHAAFPFQWHEKSLHPISHAIIYLFQSYFAVYCLTWLLCIEGLSICIYAEITFGIEVLCLELRQIHRHNYGLQELRMETNRLVKLHQKIVEQVLKLSIFCHFN